MSPIKKEELHNYEDGAIGKKIGDMVEGATTNYKQSWKSSLFEAHVNSLFGAPLAIAAHAGLLVIFSEFALEQPLVFATTVWPVFFYLSITRIYIFRRIFEKYSVALEPMAIYRKIKSKLLLKKEYGTSQSRERQEKEKEKENTE